MAYTTDQIGGFYKQYLGRDLQNEGEAQGWLNNDNAEDMIKNSGEAQEYAKKGVAGTPWSGVAGAPPPSAPAAPAFNGDYQGYFNQLFPGGNVTPQELAAKSAELAKVGITIHKSTSGDNIRLPNGQLVDVIGDAGPTSASRNLKTWQVEGAGGGGFGGGGSSAGSSFSSSSSGISGIPSGAGTELYNMLLSRAKQGTAIDSNDPNIRQQVDPYSAQVEREKRNYLADTAERRGPLANLQGEARLASERAGQASGLFEAQLIGRELQSRRDEIAQALESMRGMLSQEQQLAMQRELSQLDASIRNRQISSGNDQFMSSLGLQAENQNNYWDAVRSGLL